MRFRSHGPSEYQNALTEVWKESPQIKCLACYRFCRRFFRSWDKPTPVNSLEAKCKLRKKWNVSHLKRFRDYHISIISLHCHLTTTTFLLFSLFHHNISIVFPLPPPPHFLCFPSSITTTSVVLFSLFHHHHHHISIVFPLPPPPPPPHFYCFPSSTTTTTFPLFSLFHHQHLSSLVFPLPPPPPHFFFLSSTTFVLFSLFHHHQPHVSTVFPPPSPPPPHFFWFFSSTTTTTFLLGTQDPTTRPRQERLRVK